MADIFTRPEEEDITQLRAKIEELEAELTRLRLRNRVEEMEEEVAREERQARASQKDTGDTALYGSNLMNDDIGRFIRALTLAHLEQVRLAADAVSAGVNETYQRNRAEGGRSVEDLVRELPKDVYEGILRALKESLHIPGKVLEKFDVTSKEGLRSEAKVASGTTGSRG